MPSRTGDQSRLGVSPVLIPTPRLWGFRPLLGEGAGGSGGAKGVIEISTYGSSRQPSGRGRTKVFAALFATVALLAIPSVALATSPTDAQYTPVNEQIDQGEPPSTLTETAVATNPPSAEPTGDLPFTGLDVGLLLVAAVVLGGSGLALRRLSGASARD